MTGRSRNASRATPLVSLCASFLLAFAMLPSVLRQSPPEQNQSAQLSPDAPPDAQQSIIAALNRGSTGTAGAGEGEGAGEPTGGPTTTTSTPPGVPAPEEPEETALGRYCPHGTGRPRRQTFSVYSVGCAPAFTGDNGGRTTHGVTATEIHLAVYGLGGDGPVDDTANDSNGKRALRDLQNWLNGRYQLYGRRFRFYVVSTDTTSPAAAEAAAVRAKTQYDAFLAIDDVQINPTLTRASVNQKIVTWTIFRDNAFFSANDPYAWSFIASNDRTIGVTNELVCKQFAGKPPSFNEKQDLTFDYTKPRKFGAVILEQEGGNSNEQIMRSTMKQCGVELGPVVTYNLASGLGSSATVVAQMRQAGVTTILNMSDQLTTSQLTDQASAVSYYPEWVAYGGNLTPNSFVQSADPAQWRHAINVNLGETARPLPAQEWYRAIQQVDPDWNIPNAPITGGDDQLFFYALVQMANAIQLAGPNLTPETFASALRSIPSRPPNPAWASAGDFRAPDPWSYNK